MQAAPAEARPAVPGFRIDFWKFWVGQSISDLGSSFSTVALPLLVFKLTDSPAALALASALAFLPYLFFGLIIGAWVDRTNRRRLMIITDVLRGLLVGLLGLLALIGQLPLWFIYVDIFVLSTLGIGFTSAQFAAIPNLADTDHIVRANSLMQISYSASLVVGPALAGILTAVMPVPSLMLIDMLSFFISAGTLIWIRTTFNAEPREPTSLRHDIAEGLRYVLKHPVLRAISLMSAMFVFVDITTNAQLILYAKQRFQATDAEVGLLFTASGLGVVALSLLANPIRKRWPFGKVMLTMGVLKGIFLTLMGLTSWYWSILVLWGLSEGVTMLYTINSLSLRQTIVPGPLLGRVISIAGVLAWSAIPVGTMLGGLAIERTNDPALVYTSIGVIHLMIAIPFLFTSLRYAEKFINAEPAPQAVTPEAAVSA